MGLTSLTDYVAVNPDGIAIALAALRVIRDRCRAIIISEQSTKHRRARVNSNGVAEFY